MPDDEPIYEEIDDLLVLMDEICSEGEPDNLQPVCNAISKVMAAIFKPVYGIGGITFYGHFNDIPDISGWYFAFLHASRHKMC